ncbi:MAG TPA: TonB-dependent receptor, partial [Cellvibrionaceae bacterium]
MNAPTLKPLVLAVALATASTAYAQTNDEAGMDMLEEVVVTGFRGSLASALDLKRESTGSVDAIVAEDIASFPDSNLAESLQRIPGVAINRVAGEGRNISVRGLGPEFTRVRINGMEAMSSSGGTDAVGGANRGRGFDFNVFPSDLFSSLAVRKTASADVEEGSLGATVDMDTVRASDFDEFTLSLSAQMGYNDLSEEADPRTTFLISNMFADGKIGLLLAGSFSQRNMLDQGSSTVRWDNSNDFGTYLGSAEDSRLAEVNDAFRPRLPRYDYYQHEMERTGLAASIEFLPTDATSISLDMLYSKLDQSRQETFMLAALNNNTFAGDMNVLSHTIDNTNTVTAASFENATIQAENRYDELATEFSQVNLNFSHDFSDRLRLSAMVGQSKSEFENPIQTTIIARKRGIDFSYDYTGSNREDPVLTFGNQVGDVNGWENGGIRLRPITTDNTFDSGSID